MSNEVDEVDHVKIILNAMMSNPPSKKQKKKMNGIFNSDTDLNSDAVVKLSKSIHVASTKHKNKLLSSWNSSDFIKYFFSATNTVGISIDVNIRDSDCMKKLYDDLVTALGDRMNNYVLRDYIDWWISNKLHKMKDQSHVSIYSLRKDYYIVDFINQTQKSDISAHNTKIDTNKEPHHQLSKSDPMEIFETSGITMVLVEFGIVEACRVLKQRGEKLVYMQISDLLKNLSKEMLIKVVDLTISKKYNTADMVDFVSLSYPALRYHRIDKRYKSISYKDFFSEGVSSI